jgi:hypothetical protein
MDRPRTVFRRSLRVPPARGQDVVIHRLRSFSLMRESRIRDAFTTDRHFKQAGFVPLLVS